MDERDQLLRLKSLIDDLKKLATGWTSDAAMLDKAPSIEDWYADFYPGGRTVCLVGQVTGHPQLDDGIVTTNPVTAIDPNYQWVRTHNRFYRLGKRAQFRVLDPESPGWQTIDI